MLCGSRIPVRMRMSSVCLTEKGRTQAAFAPATRAVGRAVWLWSHFTERRQGPAQALVRPGKNGISTQATGHVIKTDDRRGGGRDTRIPTSPPASSLSPQWVDREKGQTPPIRTPGARSAPLRPGQPHSDQDGPPGRVSPLTWAGRQPAAARRKLDCCPWVPARCCSASPAPAHSVTTHLDLGQAADRGAGAAPGACRPPPAHSWASGAELGPLPGVVPPPQGSPARRHRGLLLLPPALLWDQVSRPPGPEGCSDFAL